MQPRTYHRRLAVVVSVLFNEPKLLKYHPARGYCARDNSFSALQRAEIAEIVGEYGSKAIADAVSVLFNEPKLLKSVKVLRVICSIIGFSALQRAEIAEIKFTRHHHTKQYEFQCSSTSRNC